MRRDSRHLLVVVVLLGGCTEPVATNDTATPTESATAIPTPRPIGVEYVVRAGTLPDDAGSLEVTLRVVFVERASDFGPC